MLRDTALPSTADIAVRRSATDLIFTTQDSKDLKPNQEELKP